jgi:pimeloyl-ACP methyl ester carboxylesterase
VEDLRKLAQDLNLKQFHLVGLSLGGEIAQEYALTYPTSLLSLTLVDTSLGGYPSTVDWRVYAQEQGLAKAKENWLNHPVFAVTKSKPLVFAKLKEMVDTYSGWHWLNEGFRIKLSPPAIDRLADIKLPTQVILGQLDLPYYHDIARILDAKIPNSKLHIISGAGHMSNLEDAVVFNQLLSDFINQ